MHLPDPELSVLHAAPGVLEVQGAQPDGLDLRAEQLNARLEALLDEIFMKRL